MNFELFGYVVSISKRSKLPSPKEILFNHPGIRTHKEISWKIGLIKSLRAQSDLGLKEAKDYIDSLFAKGIFVYDEDSEQVFIKIGKSIW